ncbi:UvrD-helicase domain-containing protein [bacterium]|nr:UvrD-helicase domain-containing protein [bacterium]
MKKQGYSSSIHPSHLDVKKSLVVSSPAGSGKTQKLAERYVALLGEGVLPERILAITFTEKAAAEMKERILKLLRESAPDLHEALKTKFSRFRISTVHSFALSVLDRFAFDLNLSPSLKILDAPEAELVRDEVLREGLIELGAGEKETSLLVRHLTLMEGWTRLCSRIRSLFQQIPQSYLAFEDVKSPIPQAYDSAWAQLKQEWGEGFWQASGFESIPAPEDEIGHMQGLRRIMPGIAANFLTKQGFLRKRISRNNSHVADKAESFGRYYAVYLVWRSFSLTKGIITLFRHLSLKYEERKRKEKALDFGDLEYKLYWVLYHSHNWSNILMSFDEQTDHILLDEFQDTNGLQWAIASKLVEEWRSGLGAKREIGKTPTLFLVGDVKQSIYLFRGANVEVFERAKRQMKEWMQESFSMVVIRENYRSLPLIVDFVNALFARIMDGKGEDWRTKYEDFSSRRTADDKGHVELLLTNMEPEALTKEQKEAEARNIALRINEIKGKLKVYDKEEGEERERVCRYEDITILLRSRTHLERYEEALQAYGIPFVVVGGTGFYSSLEVILLRQLVAFLSNPCDSLRLYGVLRSELFRLDESRIMNLAFHEGMNLWEKLSISTAPIEKEAFASLLRYSKKVDSEPSSMLVEEILKERGFWSCLNSDQQAENVRKFLRILEGFDEEGLSLIRISERLERMSTRQDEPKAAVNTEGRDAVRIMTIHGAKGLDSKVVFLAGLEEPFSKRKDFLTRREEGERVVFMFTDPLNKEHPEKLLWEAKLAEEQKRLFYVASTRARDALFLSGVWTSKATGWLSYMVEGLGLRETEKGLQLVEAPKGVMVNIKKPPPEHIPEKPEASEVTERKAILERLWQSGEKTYTRVSDEYEENYHESGGLLRFGEIIHVILDRISRGTIEPTQDDIMRGLRSIMLSMGFAPSSIPAYQCRVMEHVELLRASGFLERFITPGENSASEVPFLLREGNNMISGRIDRVLIKPEGLVIIDYKSFPSNFEDSDKLTEQIRCYARAAQEIWKKPLLACYILFTADACLKEVIIE